MLQDRLRAAARFLPGGLLLPFLLLLAIPPRLQAQVRDTLARRDTLAAQDTLRTDSVRPPPRLVELAAPRVSRPSAGVWVWDRSALAATGAVSLRELLDRVPGVITLRSGMFLQPEAASSFGGGGGRMEVDLDGYLLDPLTSSALDLSTIELAEIEHVVVERRLDLLRIRLRSSAPEDARPDSRVEAALGQPDANLFRGVFLAPRVLFGPFGFSVDRLDTDGVSGREPADGFGVWLQWGWIGERTGVELEMRQTRIDREPRSPWPVNDSRRDLVLRARHAPVPQVALEAYVGRTSIETEAIDTLGVPEEERPPPIERENVQAGLRGSLELPNGWVEAALRRRDHAALARWQADLSAGMMFPGIAALRADVTTQTWADVDATTHIGVRAEVGPFLGFQPYAEYTIGERGAPVFADTIDRPPTIEDRTAYRLGADFTWRGLFGGGALVHAQADSVAPYRLPFDSVFTYFPGGEVTGWQAYGRIPLFVSWLAAEGSLLRWISGSRWPYLPDQTWRAGLQAHASPLPSGNLELFGTLEAVHRGALSAPDPEAMEPAFTIVPSRTVYNLHLQIRILELRIWARWEDLVGNAVSDLPGRPIFGPRLIYGVKWQFWN